MWTEWGQELLEECAVTGKTVTGLPAMKPVIEFGMLYRVELALLKSHIEVFIGFLSVYLIFVGKIAPIFPIFYWQYIRVKYVVSNFNQTSFKLLDHYILKKVFPSVLYT